IFEADPVPRLAFTSHGRQKPEGAESSPELALHPGSGSEKKNWPETKWVELIERLIHETSWQLLLVGGEAEGERLQRLAAALPPGRARVVQSLPLAELGALLQRSAAFVGYDSGISHLAAAVGLPGLLLWGDSAEAVWRPPSERMLTVSDEQGLANLSVEQ